jgi:DNA-binding response OmpR family regulator
MRLRALIFEDEAGLRQLLWTVFDRRGYEVFTYPDPAVCPLQHATACPCPEGSICADVIVSDIHMPGTQGIDFVEGLLRKKCRRPRLAIMSGHWTEAERARATRLGCEVFEKPFKLAEMAAWLDEVERTIAPGRRLFDW